MPNVRAHFDRKRPVRSGEDRLARRPRARETDALIGASSGLRWARQSAAGLPVPGEQRVDPVDRMIGDAFDIVDRIHMHRERLARAPRYRQGDGLGSLHRRDQTVPNWRKLDELMALAYKSLAPIRVAFCGGSADSPYGCCVIRPAGFSPQRSSDQARSRTAAGTGH